MHAFTCQIEGCDRTERGNDQWCRMHYMRWWRHGDPQLSRAGHRDVGDAVTYSGAHIRIRRVRGLASTHSCACGAPAKHWAYNHGDPNQKVDERGRAYSPDPSFYEPMCVPCHKRSDLARLEVSA